MLAFLPSAAPAPARRLPARRAPRAATMRYLTAEKAAAIDAALMGPAYAHTLDQLVELAGLAVAHAVARHYPRARPVTLVCGPGNNGADGLVAARHLAHFGRPVAVVAPPRPARPPFPRLLAQLAALGVPVAPGPALPPADVVVDAVFGFSFAGPDVRAPYAELLRAVNAFRGELVSVDVPSGWFVDGGGRAPGAVRDPDVLVSLTAPKMCARELDGRDGFAHYVGGRFVPPKLCEELDFEVPLYPGTDGIVKL